MKTSIITAVGVDVSKGKSTVAIRRPGGEIVMTPFTVLHTAEGLDKLIDTLRSIEGVFGKIEVAQKVSKKLAPGMAT